MLLIETLSIRKVSVFVIGSKSPIPCFLINKINIVGMNVTNDFPIQNCKSMDDSIYSYTMHLNKNKIFNVLNVNERFLNG